MSRKAPPKVKKRLAQKVPLCQGILKKKKDKNANEADTADAVKDIFECAFGWSKHEDMTNERRIKGNRCDISIKLEDRVRFLVEIKRIKCLLNDRHKGQLFQYAEDSRGVNWAILTNGDVLQLYKIIMRDRQHQKVVELSLTQVDPNNPVDQEKLFLFCRESVGTGLLDEYCSRQQALTPVAIANIVLSDQFVKHIVREVGKIASPRVHNQEIEDLLKQEIIKSEIVERINNMPSKPKPKPKPKPTTRKIQHSVGGQSRGTMDILMKEGIVKPGITLYFKKDNRKTCKVIDAKRILYKGKETSMSAAAKKILQVANVAPGPDHWCLEPGGLDLYTIVKKGGSRIVNKIGNLPSILEQTISENQHSVGIGHPLMKILMDKGIVKPGTTLYFKKDSSITCKVISATRILYEGEETSMTAAARKFYEKKLCTLLANGA